jgi:hypothetical protein
MCHCTIWVLVASEGIGTGVPLQGTSQQKQRTICTRAKSVPGVPLAPEPDDSDVDVIHVSRVVVTVSGRLEKLLQLLENNRIVQIWVVEGPLSVCVKRVEPAAVATQRPQERRPAVLRLRDVTFGTQIQ